MSQPTRRGAWLGAGQLHFSFDGRKFAAREGDSAASALLANGVRAFGRSVKYRRLRGILAAGPEEPNALLTVRHGADSVPNVPAPLLRLREGLVISSQNRWPSLHWDLASLLRAGGGFFGAGFYYKTFMWPSWHAWEGLIRRLAGLGAAPRSAPAHVAASEFLACDVLVAGGGPAGLAAALAAARSGARVVLCERDARCGGELDFEDALVGGEDAPGWVEAALRELDARGARVLVDTAVVAASGGDVVAHAEPGGLPGSNCLFRIHARAFVMAMGAVERPIAFVDNDLPGVMLLGAAERYLARYGARAGDRPLLFASHDRAYLAARRFLEEGLEVVAVVDARPASALGAVAARVRTELESRGVPCLAGSAVLAAHGADGVRAATVAPLGGGRARRFECDAVLASGGWSAALHAGTQQGGARTYQGEAAGFVVAPDGHWRHAAGACAGEWDLAAALAGGTAAGCAAAGQAGCAAADANAPAADGDPPPALQPFWRSPCVPRDRKRQFVDLQNDVTVADLQQALDEGFGDIEHAKRYTTLGVGTEQGRTSGTPGAAILGELRKSTLGQVGLSRLRPPFHPVTLRSIAGQRVGAALRVARRTPLHAWHLAHGGVADHMGLWLRPRYYRGNGADGAAAAYAEARRVRMHGGIVDGSTLGKIEVQGPEAAAFLDHLYMPRASAIRVGRAKYMANLREDGMVLDDGLVLRLAPGHFLATVSSGHAGHMLSHFEHYRETDWRGRAVALTDVTEAWSVIVAAGPASRATLQQVLGEAWSAVIARLAHMELCDGEWQGAGLRVLRASFSGELAFELHCRPAIAVPLWTALERAGLGPYGLDALDILRVEKGYLTTSEINGQATPMDLGLKAMLEAAGPCVGRALLDRPAFHEESRPRLVGLRSADGRTAIPAGAQLTLGADDTTPCGYVTSSAMSPALGEPVALAFVARSVPGEGAGLYARDPLRGACVRVRSASPVHYDPAATRMKA